MAYMLYDDFVHVLFLDSEDEDDIFLPKIGLHANYCRVVYPRRLNSS
jgi:hypothetical protein